MGYTSYCCDTRSLRASSMGYATKSVDQIFTQQKERKSHPEMDSKNIKIRECRDSEAHPNTVPIILALDVTGSMGHIPHDLIKTGLPTLMGDLIQKGCKDASLCFLAIGDHECDYYPLQAGQFESGDAELDMWLTRTFIEGRGGGNAGESYLLAWDFANSKVVTDAWDKRGKKGILITIGDEPCLEKLPLSALKEIYGENCSAQGNQTAQEILEKAKEKWEIFHLNLGSRYNDNWGRLLKQRNISVRDYKDIPNKVVEIVLTHSETKQGVQEQRAEKPEEIEIL